MGLPPVLFMSGLMQLAVVEAAERHGVLIAHFAAHRARLSKAQMMRVGRLSTTDQTGLRGHELKMLSVAVTTFSSMSKYAFVDLTAAIFVDGISAIRAWVNRSMVIRDFGCR